MPMHEFLIKMDGHSYDTPTRPRVSTLYIPKIRDALENVPETKGMWKPQNRIDDLPMQGLTSTHFEFCGIWPAPDRLAAAQDRMFANPGALDVERYAEAFDPDDPSPDRVDDAKRLYRLGWSTERIATRFGVGDDPSQVRYAVNADGTSVRDLHNEFRQAAADTYAHLVHEQDMLATEVARIYGRPPSTMRTWAGKFTDAGSIDDDERTRRSTRALKSEDAGRPERIRADD